MNMKNNLENIMKQAQQMQEKMEQVQKELGNTLVVGKAGGDMVEVHITCLNEFKKTIIKDEALEEDKAFLEDLITAACNDAIKKATETSRGAMSKVTSGLNLPKDFQMPGGG